MLAVKHQYLIQKFQLIYLEFTYMVDLQNKFFKFINQQLKGDSL